MTQTIKSLATAFAAIPAERAGNSTDNATRKAAREVEKAGQQIQHAANPVKK